MKTSLGAIIERVSDNNSVMNTACRLRGKYESSETRKNPESSYLRWGLPISNRVKCRVSTHPWKSLKIFEFFLLNSKPWKYLKTGQVLGSPWISFHMSFRVLEFTKSNYALSATSLNNICIGLEMECMCFTYLEIFQVFCLTQDLLIIVMFCFCQLKLFRNHRNRY